MKVRLLATDSKIPNLAIMKISGYHKSLGDDVFWYNPLEDMNDTDILYENKKRNLRNSHENILLLLMNSKFFPPVK